MGIKPKQIWQHGGVLVAQDTNDEFYRLAMDPVLKEDGWQKIEREAVPPRSYAQEVEAVAAANAAHEALPVQLWESLQQADFKVRLLSTRLR